VLHAALAQDHGFRERFRQESVAAARLSHPNIVSTYDTGDEAGTIYIVTEMVKGRPIADVLANDGPLPPAQAAVIADQVAAGLEHAHRAGMIHGAVSTGNVFVSDDGVGGTRVKLADFGIAPAGAAPSGASEDVRSLGAVLYEMLCDHKPRPEADGEPVRPRKLRAGIPKPLEVLTMRALSQDPRQRFRSAFDFRRSLAALDLGPDDAVPYVARVATPPAGVPAAARRARRTWVPLVIFVVLAAAAAGGVTWIMGRGNGKPATGPSVPAGSTVAVASVSSYDPEATPSTENEERARFAVDGNPATSWTTERYHGAHFGRLKTGVGLILRLSGEHRLSRLEVRSTTRNWSAEVYVAPSAKTRLSDWGRPVAERTGVSGETTFNLQSRKGAAVLLWITDPGQTYQLEVSELVLSG
jgi:eukaryotic-like serine/threonine-protein kinase